MKYEGRLSFFGGPGDSGMDHTEGLAYYEHHEADLRPELFMPKSTDPTEGCSKRLKALSAFYLALREDDSRECLQGSIWKITNQAFGWWVIGSLVDWGPNKDTGRVVDVSPAIGLALRVRTDDTVTVERLL